MAVAARPVALGVPPQAGLLPSAGPELGQWRGSCELSRDGLQTTGRPCASPADPGPPAPRRQTSGSPCTLPARCRLRAGRDLLTVRCGQRGQTGVCRQGLHPPGGTRGSAVRGWEGALGEPGRWGRF